jgi:hypothetical protein
LARPHLVTWLFTLFWFQLLDSLQRGERRSLFIFPAMMLLWVNLHGGFLMGIALTVVFAVGNAVTWTTSIHLAARALAAERLRQLASVLLLTLSATLVTPYSIRLYWHLYGYLTSTFLMNNIQEFLSPDFHQLQMKAFALLLVLAMLAFALEGKQAGAPALLVVAFSAWIGLFAVRNVPIAAMLISVTIAPLLGATFRRAALPGMRAHWLHKVAFQMDAFSFRMRLIDRRFNKHMLAGLVVLAMVATATMRGATGSARLSFDDGRMPLAAAEYMAANHIRDHFFAPDNWSGYLIYRLYPDVRVMMDDRHDFYGERFVRDYLKVAQAERGWREVLDANRVNWVLAPAESPLASVLKETSDWHLTHADGTAAVFARNSPMPPM